MTTNSQRFYAISEALKDLDQRGLTVGWSTYAVEFQKFVEQAGSAEFVREESAKMTDKVSALHSEPAKSRNPQINKIFEVLQHAEDLIGIMYGEEVKKYGKDTPAMVATREAHDHAQQAKTAIHFATEG